jgi:putative oxidoreductase
MNRGLNPELGLAILRVVLGVIFIAHGAPNMFGGMEALQGFFAQLGIPLPAVTAWLIVLLEVFGGLMLIVGFLVAPIAALLAVHMVAGIIVVHARNGFYVIGHGQGGVEFNLILVVSLLMLILGGPGLAALDNRRGVGGVADV